MKSLLMLLAVVFPLFSLSSYVMMLILILRGSKRGSKGHVDMHAHLTSHRGFGGKVFFGEPMSEKGHGHEFRSL